MVQAIQVLRFHLLELEKVSVFNVLFIYEGIHFKARWTGFEWKISPDIVQYRFDYPRARVSILNRDNVSISCEWRTHTSRAGHTSSSLNAQTLN